MRIPTRLIEKNSPSPSPPCLPPSFAYSLFFRADYRSPLPQSPDSQGTTRFVSLSACLSRPPSASPAPQPPGEEKTNLPAVCGAARRLHFRRKIDWAVILLIFLLTPAAPKATRACRPLRFFLRPHPPSPPSRAEPTLERVAVVAVASRRG